MKRIWNEKNITKALKNLPKASAKDVVFNRVWFKIEDKLAAQNKPLVIWRPWVHPIRWVAAAACFCFVFTGILYHQDSVDKTELANYVMSVSDPAADVTSDWGIVKVSSLLLEPPAASIKGVLTDEDNNKGTLSNDALFL